LKLYHFLRLTRTICAVIVLLLVSLTFFDIYSFTSHETSRYIALTQFIPSLLSFLHAPSFLFSAFIVVILITLAAGRSYCSFLCPLGIFQDAVIRLTSILNKQNNSGYTPPYEILRYSILTITVISFSSAGTFLIIWLDPFSIYGRFSSNILSPAVTGLNNITSVILSKFDIYYLHSIDIKYADAGLIFIVLLIILSISISAMFKGRIYCSTICPVGTLLGLISKISFFKIEIDKETCIHCGKCEKICKSSCIEHIDEHVDFSRCVSCFNCLTVCPNSSIKFKPSFLKNDKTDEEISDNDHLKSYREKAKIGRKAFIAGIVFIPAFLSAQTSAKKQLLYVIDSTKQKIWKKKTFTSPPGSLNISQFNDRCTACSLCITKCPSSVLQPAVMQYGVYGILQPYLDFKTGYCNYDCIICSEVCPSGAINKISVAEKHLIQTGKSIFIKENCITYTNGTDCGACSEHCPTKAVNMIPFRDNLVIPKVNQAICIGCGACEYVCPVRPIKAIYVEGSKTHEKAELPRKLQQIEKKEIKQKEDFPF